MIRKIAALAIVLLTVGCAGQVQTTVTTFHTLPAHGGGQTIAVVAGDKDKEGTLEFRAYAEKLGIHLQKAGYTVVHDQKENPPTYIAILNYGIDNGTLVTSAYSIPQWGVTGSSGSTTTGTISNFGGTSTLNATTTSIPQYGVTGYTTGTTTDRLFKRAVILNIYDAQKLRAGAADAFRSAQVYDGKLTSDGTCGSVAGVMDQLLEAMFTKFPGESGRAQSINVKFDGKC